MTKQEQKSYFGTDGVRGRVGDLPMTPDWVLKFGWVVGKALSEQVKPVVVIAKDTRLSGYMFESALEAGLMASGADVMLLGPMPTPAVSVLVQHLKADIGIMVSASHNPFEDNGLKLFGADGEKISKSLENSINLLMAKTLSSDLQVVEAVKMGKASRFEQASLVYSDYLEKTLPISLKSSDRFKRLNIVLDCANGANYHIAPEFLRRMGASITTIGCAPDGVNINVNSGSTSLSAIKEAVLTHQADIGIAFDGDADRVILIDEHGQVVDGDAILYLLALAAQRKGELKGGVVGTLMSNVGLEIALKSHGIPFERTQVGDKYVTERLKDLNWFLGGENSGHVVMLQHGKTGDGLLVALHVLVEMVVREQSLSSLLGGLELLPQVLVNVKVKTDGIVSEHPKVKQLVAEVEEHLGGRGRVLLRPSGTEPLIRVMVEGDIGVDIKAQAEKIAELITDTM